MKRIVVDLIYLPSITESIPNFQKLSKVIKVYQKLINPSALDLPGFEIKKSKSLERAQEQTSILPINTTCRKVYRGLLFCVPASAQNLDSLNIFPSIKTIAKNSGVSPGQVARYLKQEEDAGFIEIDDRVSNNREINGYTSCSFRFTDDFWDYIANTERQPPREPLLKRPSRLMGKLKTNLKEVLPISRGIKNVFVHTWKQLSGKNERARKELENQKALEVSPSVEAETSPITPVKEEKKTNNISNNTLRMEFQTPTAKVIEKDFRKMNENERQEVIGTVAIELDEQIKGFNKLSGNGLTNPKQIVELLRAGFWTRQITNIDNFIAGVKEAWERLKYNSSLAEETTSIKRIFSWDNIIKADNGRKFDALASLRLVNARSDYERFMKCTNNDPEKAAELIKWLFPEKIAGIPHNQVVRELIQSVEIDQTPWSCFKTAVENVAGRLGLDAFSMNEPFESPRSIFV